MRIRILILIGFTGLTAVVAYYMIAHRTLNPALLISGTLGLWGTIVMFRDFKRRMLS